MILGLISLLKDKEQEMTTKKHPLIRVDFKDYITSSLVRIGTIAFFLWLIALVVATIKAVYLAEVKNTTDGILIFISITSFIIFIILFVMAFVEMEKMEGADRKKIEAEGAFAILCFVISILTYIAIDDKTFMRESLTFDFKFNDFKENLAHYWGYGKVVIIFTTLFYLGRFFYLYRLSKNSSKMFACYKSIVEKYHSNGEPTKDRKMKIFKIEPELVNPLNPELWDKNVVQNFVNNFKN